MANSTASLSYPRRIDEILAAAPNLAKAFLTGLEAGYQLGAAGQEQEKEEKKQQ